MMIAAIEDEDDDDGDGATGNDDGDGATGDGATGYNDDDDNGGGTTGYEVDDYGEGATGDDDYDSDDGGGWERRQKGAVRSSCCACRDPSACRELLQRWAMLVNEDEGGGVVASSDKAQQGRKARRCLQEGRVQGPGLQRRQWRRAGQRGVRIGGRAASRGGNRRGGSGLRAMLPLILSMIRTTNTKRGSKGIKYVLLK